MIHLAGRLNTEAPLRPPLLQVATGITFDGDYKDELTLTEDPTLATTNLNQSSTVQAVYAHWSSDGEVDLVQQHDPANRTRCDDPAVPPPGWPGLAVFTRQAQS